MRLTKWQDEEHQQPRASKSPRRGLWDPACKSLKPGNSCHRRKQGRESCSRAAILCCGEGSAPWEVLAAGPASSSEARLLSNWTSTKLWPQLSKSGTTARSAVC